MRDQSPKTSIVQLENVSSSADAKWYLGKRVAYLYHGQKAKVKKNGKKSHVRVMWGHITRVHGNSGLVRAKFVKPLPPSSFGSSLRVVCAYIDFVNEFLCTIVLCINVFFFLSLLDALSLSNINPYPNNTLCFFNIY